MFLLHGSSCSLVPVSSLCSPLSAFTFYHGGFQQIISAHMPFFDLTQGYYDVVVFSGHYMWCPTCRKFANPAAGDQDQVISAAYLGSSQFTGDSCHVSSLLIVNAYYKTHGLGCQPCAENLAVPRGIEPLHPP